MTAEGQLNTTTNRVSNTSTVDYPHPEPRPDWSRATRQWQGAWPAHTVGFAVTFVLIDIYVIIVSTSLRRRLAAQPYTAMASVFLCVAGACQSAYLFIDPYESHASSLVLRVLYVIVHPALMTSYNLQQSALVRLTKSGQMSSVSKRKVTVIAVFVTSFFITAILIEMFIAVDNNCRLLRIMTQSVFIMWTLVSCFSFVYNGFTVAQFTKDANKALQQFAEYSRAKNTLSPSQWRQVCQRQAQVRRSKVFYRREDADDLSLSSSGSTSDSALFVTEASLESAFQQSFNSNVGLSTRQSKSFVSVDGNCIPKSVSRHSVRRTKSSVKRKPQQSEEKTINNSENESEFTDGDCSTEDETEVGFSLTGNGSKGISVVSATYLRKGLARQRGCLTENLIAAASRSSVSFHNNALMLPYSANNRSKTINQPLQNLPEINSFDLGFMKSRQQQLQTPVKRFKCGLSNPETNLNSLNNNSRRAWKVDSSESLMEQDNGMVVGSSVQRCTDDAAADDGEVKDDGYAADTEACVTGDNILHPPTPLPASRITDSPLQQPFVIRPVSGYLGLNRIRRASQMQRVGR